METEEQLTAWRDQMNAWQRDTIRKYGWAVTAVFGEEEEPPFAYAVGLSGFDHPELLVVGLPEGAAGRVLNDYGERVRAGQRLVPGERRVDPVAGLPLKLIEVTDSLAAGLLDANALYQGESGRPVPALQIVVSDGDGRFPWEAGCTTPGWLQPLFGSVAS